MKHKYSQSALKTQIATVNANSRTKRKARYNTEHTTIVPGVASTIQEEFRYHPDDFPPLS